VKPKIHTLSADPDFSLFAIASPLSEYNLCLLFNEKLSFKFQQSEAIIVSDKKNNSECRFGVYMYEEGVDSVFTLYANRSGNNTLIKSLKNLDFILKYHGQLSLGQVLRYIEILRKQKNIQLATAINMQEIKQKELQLFF
jgi:hypothetical protein